jgi:hypothetical protein
MSSNENPRPQPPVRGETEIREGAWQVIQQGAQVFGEIGGGIAGIAAGVKVIGDKFGGGSSGGSTPSQSTPSPSNESGQE